MTREELKQGIASISHQLIANSHQPIIEFEETGEFLNVIIPSAILLPIMQQLRTDKQYDFDYLFCLTCVDWKEHFMMVYHLFSKTHKHTLVVKGKITDQVNPEIETVSHIWKTADYLEREVYDLFGVNFLHHPDLRRLFLEDGWEGFPLRKDYVDKNMIVL
jgi:NADH:ubiquinone oxidoreductase subunit C